MQFPLRFFKILFILLVMAIAANILVREKCRHWWHNNSSLSSLNPADSNDNIFGQKEIVFSKEGFVELPTVLESWPKSVRQDEYTLTKATEPKMKIILFWTHYYKEPDFYVGYGRELFVRGGCEVTNCITTADRNLLNQSDALIFHGFQVNKTDLPQHRSAHQRFIFFMYETIPMNDGNQCAETCLPSNQLKPHYFNWTMTHRRDSDVYVAEQYGAIIPKQPKLPIQLPAELPPNFLPLDPAVLLKRTYPKIAQKTNTVAWFVSHCSTHSRREDYVKELAKFIQVDVYGKCGTMTMDCMPRYSPRCEKLLTTYKFYLALENSICPDYVTEKFYKALMNDVVPIVYGGADYTEYAPPHSFINIADFKSPKDLAEYLALLDKNDALYSAYFQWKRHYKVIRKPMKGWCDLCAKLNEPNQERKSYKNVEEWWVHKMPCYPGSSFLLGQI